MEAYKALRAKLESESDFERQEGPGKKCWGIIVKVKLKKVKVKIFGSI